jgi:hypothetical protein
MSEIVSKPGDLKPGDIYQDTSDHPCLCVSAEGMEVTGISLIDGTYPRAEDIGLSGLSKLSIEEAWSLRMKFAHRERKAR